MPIHYECDRDRNRILATTVDPVSLSDALAIIDRQAADGAWSYGVLYDNRDSDYLPSTADLHALVKHVGRLTTQYGPRGPVALVVSDSARHEASRRYASMAELTALHVNVFKTIEDAERWLEQNGP